MDKQVHPVVELLLARMKSHPDEFRDMYYEGELMTIKAEGRWETAIRMIRNEGSKEDRDALDKELRGIRLNQAHEWAMDELLNGEERRRKEREQREEDEKRWAQQRVAQVNPYINVANAYGLNAPSPPSESLAARIKRSLGI